MAPPPTSNPAPPPEPPFLQVQDGLLEKIFLPTAMMPPLPAPSSHQTPLPVLSISDIPDVLLPTAADLACVSTARASFRRVISDHAFLRRYRALHLPPLIGMLLVPAQPPHPSAVPARTFVGFDFSCSSFLPSTAGRSWSPINFFDGRVLLAGAPVEEKSGRHILVGSDEICDWDYRNFLVRDLAVCDPVHRRYILLPIVPGDLKALIRRPDLLSLETFLAPGEDDKDPLSFRVLCLAECRMNLLLLTFSSLHGQWHVLTYNQWSADSTFASFQNYESWLCKRQFVHGRFYWHLHFQNELLVLDVCTMEFSAVNLPAEQLGNNSFVIVETTDGTLGMLTRGFDEDSVDDRYWLTYSIMRNNQWHFEKIIRLPVKRAILVGVTGGYLIIEAVYTTSSQDEPKFGYFSVDLKTLQVELFAALSKPIYPGRLYAGFPTSLCAPTI